MRKIGSYSGSVDDIVERQLSDKWAGLKKKGKWLLEVERVSNRFLIYRNGLLFEEI